MTQGRRRGSQPSGVIRVTPISGGMNLQVPARWEGVQQVPILFANHVFVHAVEGQFLVTFGRAELPYAQLTPDVQKKLQTEGLPIVAVARVVVGAEKMPEVVKAFADVYENWRKSQQHAPAQATSEGEPS